MDQKGTQKYALKNPSQITNIKPLAIPSHFLASLALLTTSTEQLQLLVFGSVSR